ncbi:hypothetical protein Slin14017_G068450 [Septoria linicola]|nr:hypothetical protein Slin14017_G068450 [Septoria linicola]
MPIDIFARLLAREREKRSPQTSRWLTPTITTPLNPLCALPTEIIQHIALEYLPIESQAAPAFSCRHLKHILGTSSWLLLRRDPVETTASSRQALEDFLILLSRDLELGSGIVCFKHVIIHKRRNRPNCYAAEGTAEYKLSGA